MEWLFIYLITSGPVPVAGQLGPFETFADCSKAELLFTEYNPQTQMNEYPEGRKGKCLPTASQQTVSN